MDIELIIQSIMGLVALLSVLLFLLFLTNNNKSSNNINQKSKKKNVGKELKKESKVEDDTSLDGLRSVIKEKKSTTAELRKALELIINFHGTIHPKLGVRTHPDFDPYMDILFSICRHPNADKDMIISFDKELCRYNPEYKQDINEAMTKGLNSRRV